MTKSRLEVVQDTAFLGATLFGAAIVYELWWAACGADGEVTGGERSALLACALGFFLVCLGARAAFAWKPGPVRGGTRDEGYYPATDPTIRSNLGRFGVVASISASTAAAGYFLWRGSVHDHGGGTTRASEIMKTAMLVFWAVVTAVLVLGAVGAARAERRKNAASGGKNAEKSGPASSGSVAAPEAPSVRGFVVYVGGLSLAMWWLGFASDGKITAGDQSRLGMTALGFAFLLSLFVGLRTRRRRWDLGEHPASPGYERGPRAD